MGKEYTRQATILGQIPIAGQIITYDNFEGLLHWLKYLGPGDSIFELDPSLARTGNQSLYFKSRTTSAAENDLIGGVRNFYLLPSKRMIITSSFYITNATPIKYIAFLFYWYDGAKIHTARVHYNPNTPSWEYYDSAGDPIVIPALAINFAFHTWHTVSLHANFHADKYISLVVDHISVDLSDLSLQVNTSTSYSTLATHIFLCTAGAAPASLNIDECIIHEL